MTVEYTYNIEKRSNLKFIENDLLTHKYMSSSILLQTRLFFANQVGVFNFENVFDYYYYLFINCIIIIIIISI